MRTFSPAVADPLEGLLHQVVLAVPAPVEVAHPLLLLTAVGGEEPVWSKQSQIYSQLGDNQGVQNKGGFRNTEELTMLK